MLKVSDNLELLDTFDLFLPPVLRTINSLSVSRFHADFKIRMKSINLQRRYMK